MLYGTSSNWRESVVVMAVVGGSKFCHEHCRCGGVEGSVTCDACGVDGGDHSVLNVLLY